MRFLGQVPLKSMIMRILNSFIQGGASGIRDLTATGFSLNIFKETDSGWAISPDKAAAANWVLLWSASGYGC